MKGLVVALPVAYAQEVTQETDASISKIRSIFPGVDVVKISSWCPYESRNEAARKAIQSKVPLLSIDSDISFEPNHVLALLADESPIVGIPYTKHDAKNEELCCGYWADVPGTLRFLVKGTKGDKFVKWAGAGFLKIDYRVFEKMPWWFTPEKVDHNGKRGVVSDDVGFCMNAEAAGFNIKMLCDYRVEHIPRGKKPQALDLRNWRLDFLSQTSMMNEKAMALCNLFEKYMERISNG